jgi:hypothetical protein
VRQLNKPEAMNAASMGKAKLHGLITDKRKTKHGFAEEFMSAMMDDLPDTTWSARGTWKTKSY